MTVYTPLQSPEMPHVLSQLNFEFILKPQTLKQPFLYCRPHFLTIMEIVFNSFLFRKGL